jgi:poly(3-hydroxybutyrate) depolymerase
MSSWKLKQSKQLCASATVGDGKKRRRPTQWDVTKTREDNDDESRSFTVYLPPNFCTDSSTTLPLRILLAIHGFGGNSMQEIKKWQDVADSLNAIIIAPVGTETIGTHKLGWNAIDCCGDPVLNEIDDMDFVVNGVIEVFLNEVINSSSNSMNSMQPHVIATGFSNGGFFTSLMGLSNNRPEWLVGIVPTGGYQYDINSYRNTHQPLPIFMHHGGKDSVVDPNGCCIIPKEAKQRKDGSKTNCPFDIGAKQDSCQSIESVFHLWSQINGCSSDDNSRSMEENDNLSKCFEGKDCKEPTNFCMWTYEGHSWGGTFPGTSMMQPWMQNVFVQAELTKKIEPSDNKKSTNKSYAPIATNHRTITGRLVFLSATSVLFGFVAIVYLFLRRRNFIKSSTKRKTSLDQEEMMMLGREIEMNATTSRVVSIT